MDVGLGETFMCRVISSTSLPSMPLIWVVEDDPSVQRLIEADLKAHGFVPAIFGNAEKAYGALGYSKIPALIILDILLPGMSGVALVQTLTSGGKGPPAVIMTGRDDPYTVELVKQVAPVRCLRKPFSDDDLFDLRAPLVSNCR